MRLQDKVAVITGCGSGIGEAIATRFASEGVKVFGVDWMREAGERVASQITRAGGSIVFHEADVSQERAVERMVAECVARLGSLDILVNNAAVQHEVALHETSMEQWHRMIDVNLGGVFLGCKYAIPVMIEQSRGVIINMSSVMGLVADPRLAVYCATKGGILAMTRAIAIAYGRQGIRATCICPGDVDTPLNQVYFNSYPDPAAARAAIEEHYPLGRIATPDEIARVAVFLASDDATFITGTHVLVDGGVLSTIY
ncbi:MAG TPA: glucose 1-dehydrogenase [Ktedonobacteraceae bacterium]|nr:glucose 1-dehydrogenase [Ktedonobacteraceae bacterium]